MNPSKMKFLCFGVGAIGTYIGGSLAAAGHNVVFVERPAVAEEVRRRGLSLRLPVAARLPAASRLPRAAELSLKALSIPNPQVADSIAAALAQGPFDAAILAVKSFDTQSVLEDLLPYAGDVPPILSFQNGVENEPLLAAKLGAEKVIPGTVTTAVGRAAAGEIVVERLRGIGIATNHPLGAALVDVMDQAGLRARGYANPAAMKWSKMLTNLIANASAAILNLTPALIFSDRRLYQMEARQLRETLRVMEAMNIPVVDLPATPVRLLAWAVTRLPLSLSRMLLSRSVGKGRGGKMPSFHIDLYSGRGKSEVDFLNGAVVRYGEQAHVATPVNKTLNEILNRLTCGEIPLDTYAGKPDRLLAEIPGD